MTMPQLYASRSDFKIVRPLGQPGGFGMAMLGKHQSHFQDIVLKEVSLTKISMAQGTDPKLAAKLVDNSRKEHVIMAKFFHPNIVRVFGSFEEKYKGPDGTFRGHDMYYLVMEYCQGGDMNALIRSSQKAFSEPELRSWSGQLVSAVRFLHEQGHVHRDIKPKNIFLSYSHDTVKLGDFGLAKDVANVSQNSMTLVATWEYASPEFCQSKPYGPPSDVWSLGVTLYEMAHFYRPFPGSAPAVIGAIMHQPAKTFDASRGGYSASFRDFVMKMLEKDITRRPNIAAIVNHPFLGVQQSQEQSQVSQVTHSIRPETPANDATAKYHQIVNSPHIAEEHKGIICQTLKEELLTVDQFLEADEETVKALFPKLGIQMAVLRWRRKIWEEGQRQMEKSKEEAKEAANNSAIQMHSAANRGDLTTMKALLKDVRSKLPKETSSAEVATILKLLIDHKDANNYNKTPLLEAAQRGLLAVVTFLVDEQKADLNAQDDDGYYAIHCAAQWGSLDVIAYLLQRKPDLIEARNKLGTTPFQNAAIGGKLENVRYFVEKTKANIFAKDTENQSMAIHLAAEFGSVEVISYLLQRKPDFLEARNQQGRTPLLQAVMCGKLENVRYLVEDAKANMDATDNEHQSMAIHLAALFGTVDVIAYLLQRRPSFIEATNKLGRTPLLEAVTSDKQENVRYLVEKGKANINAKDSKFGSLAIHLAAQFGSVEAIDYLLQRRPAFLEAKNNLGRTPLLNAAIGGKLENLRYFVEKANANINATDSNFESMAIHLAAQFGSVEVIAYLLQRRPDFIEARNKLGRTPFQNAAISGQLDNMRYLHEKAKAKIDAKDTGQESMAIHLAAQFGSVEGIDYLLQCRPDFIEVRNKLGRTPFLEAASSDKLGNVRFLLEKANAKIDARDTEQEALAIHLASLYGSVDVIAYLLQRKPDFIEARNSFGRTPFLEAVSGDKLENVRYLLENAKGKINAKDSEHESLAIHLAALSGSDDIIAYLLQRKPDFIEARNKLGRTPLLEAASGDSVENVRYLVESARANLLAKDDKFGGLAIHLAAQSGSVEMIAYLLRLKPDFIEARNSLGRTPFLEAASADNLENVRYFLEKTDADIYAEDNKFKSMAIHLAVQFGSVELIEYLLKRKPDFLEARNSLGRTPLLIAVIGGKLDNVRYLVEKGKANIYAKDSKFESTAIHLAAQFSSVEVIAYLLRRRPDFVEAHNKLGRTPLHNAAIAGRLDNVRFLVENANADLEAEDTEQQSMTIHLAALFGSVEVIEYLLQRKPNFLEVRNKLGRTPLLEAASGGKLENVQYLVEKANADIRATVSNKGDNALHLAAYFGKLQVVRYLVERQPALINALNSHRNTPLDDAKWQNQTNVVAFLESLDTTEGSTMFIASRQSNKEEMPTWMSSKSLKKYSAEYSDEDA